MAKRTAAQELSWSSWKERCDFVA